MKPQELKQLKEVAQTLLDQELAALRDCAAEVSREEAALDALGRDVQRVFQQVGAEPEVCMAQLHQLAGWQSRNYAWEREVRSALARRKAEMERQRLVAGEAFGRVEALRALQEKLAVEQRSV